ncbi:hypothetical protein [Geoalkalibacter halelectricus]|uniref:DNA recombination protein RmuC n=1 Tax=Geoalkalibacter halelectricus TaxID=2847045 RepID=A0ABY5ZSH9_9BACT|nr:hypothetical protein [Geoalkalibacter halelectricus]MDO3379142.1 hypothetical protein [Geoalkalibacter halelectricus]UWZ80902.1 hypothetical protein L9S41_05730 [Geoalkalibacter halelectricus]
MEIIDLAFVVGLVLGTLAILSVCWVWIKRQILGTGGAMLSLVGVLLVGLSVWSSARFAISPEGFEAEFSRLEQRVNEVAHSSNALREEVLAVAENVETSRTQFLHLTEALETRRALPPQTLEEVRRPLLTLPSVEPQQLERRLPPIAPER